MFVVWVYSKYCGLFFMKIKLDQTESSKKRWEKSRWRRGKKDGYAATNWIAYRKRYFHPNQVSTWPVFFNRYGRWIEYVNTMN